MKRRIRCCLFPWHPSKPSRSADFLPTSLSCRRLTDSTGPEPSVRAAVSASSVRSQALGTRKTGQIIMRQVRKSEYTLNSLPVFVRITRPCGSVCVKFLRRRWNGSTMPARAGTWRGPRSPANFASVRAGAACLCPLTCRLTIPRGGGAGTLFRRGRRPGSRRIRFSKAVPRREPGHPRCRRQESGRAPAGRPSAAVGAEAGGSFQGFRVVFSGLRPSCRGGDCGNRGQAARSRRAFRGKRRSRPAGHNLSRGFYVRAAGPSGGRCSRL